MPEGNKRLRGKEGALVDALATTGHNVAEAGRIAGYADRHATYAAVKTVRQKLQEVLETQGVTADAIVSNCIHPAMTAMSVERGWKDGVCIQEVSDIDHTTRLRVAAMYAVLTGAKQDVHIKLNQNNFNTLIDLSGASDDDIDRILDLAKSLGQLDRFGPGGAVQGKPGGVAPR
jgi:hypothetical protein